MGYGRPQRVCSFLAMPLNRIPYEDTDISPFAVQKVQKLNFWGVSIGAPSLWAYDVQLLCSLPRSSSVEEENAMRVQLAQQAKEVWVKRLGDYHRAGR